MLTGKLSAKWQSRSKLSSLWNVVNIVVNMEWGVHHAGDTNEHHTPRRGWDLFQGNYVSGQVTCWHLLTQAAQAPSARNAPPHQIKTLLIFHVEARSIFVWNISFGMMVSLWSAKNQWMIWRLRLPGPVMWVASDLTTWGSMCWLTPWILSMFGMPGRDPKRTRPEAKAVQVPCEFCERFRQLQ